VKSKFNSEQEANDYKTKHQLFSRVVEPISGTGKWALVFPIEAHLTVIDSSGMVVSDTPVRRSRATITMDIP